MSYNSQFFVQALTMTVLMTEYIYRQTEYRAHNIKCGYEHFNVVVALDIVLRSWIYLYRYSMININVIMSL